MKFFAVLALFVAVAQASLLLPGSIPASVVSAQEQTEIQEIIAAINHPSTDPATAALLEDMLFDILGIEKPTQPIVVEPAVVDESPISVGPAIVDNFVPIVVGPAIVDSYEPISVGPAIVDNFEPIVVGPAVVEPSPVVVAPAESSSAPLVQIILNINNGQSSAIAGSPVAVEFPSQINPTPVAVVESPINPTPVVVVDPINPTPVIVEEIAPEPVVIGTPVLPTPVIVPEPVVIGTPILPSPVAILPEELN